MTYRLGAALVLVFLATALVAPARRADDAPAVHPGKAIEVLRTYCFECHGGKATRGKMKIEDRKALVDGQLARPGNPDASELLLLIESGQMPPGKSPKPTPEERKLIRDWIQARMPELPQPVVSGEDFLLDLIGRDWAMLPAEDKPSVRYISLNHLAATEEGRKRLPRARDEIQRVLKAMAAPGKALELTAVDKLPSVWRFNLQSAGWDARKLSTGEEKKTRPLTLTVWDVVQLDYPYGVLSFKSKAWPSVVPMLQATRSLRPLPYLRADWLAAALTDRELGTEVLTLLGHTDEITVPPALPASVWPDAISLDEAVIELGWTADREGLGGTLRAVGLRELGGIRRAEWERIWPRLNRKLERGMPVFPLDQARRESFTSDPKYLLKARTLDFNTKPPKTPKDRFYGGELFEVELTTSHPSMVELAVFHQHQQYEGFLEPMLLKAGERFVEDNKHEKTKRAQGIQVDDVPAKEFWVLVGVSREGGEARLETGVPAFLSTARKKFRERFVHPTLYELNDDGTDLKTPFDWAARSFVLFESLGPNPKGKPKPPPKK